MYIHERRACGATDWIELKRCSSQDIFILSNITWLTDKKEKSLIMEARNKEFTFVSLRNHPELLDETANLLNTEWPTSLAAR